MSESITSPKTVSPGPGRTSRSRPADPRGAGPVWRVILLGGFALTRDGWSIRLPPTGQRLIALLGLRGPGLRSGVAGLLSGDLPEARALASLRTMVWRLHRAGLDLAESGSPILALPPRTEVDITGLGDQFDRGPADPGRLPAQSPGGSWELLPGWYDDWVLVERERIRQRVLHTMEAQSGLALDRDQPARALDLALLAVREAPLRESAHRLVLRAHLADGNLHEAWQHYRAVNDLFERELGVRPSPRLRAILTSAPAPGRPTTRPGPIPPAPVRSGHAQQVAQAR